MRTEPTLHHLLLVIGLGAGLAGCVVESYPVSATDTRRVPKVEIPHPAQSSIRPVGAASAAEVTLAAVREEKPLAGPVIPVLEPGLAPVSVPAAPAAPTPVAVAAGGIPQPRPQAEAVAAVVHAAPRADAGSDAGSGGAADRRRLDFLRFGELPPSTASARGTEARRPGASASDNPRSVRRVTFADEGADSDVAPGPKGDFIVFASTRHRATSDLYLQHTGSAAVTQLTSDPSNEVMPALSPDGARLAYASDRAGTWDLYLSDLRGGPTVRLTDDGSQNLHPSFSADGKWLVYCSRAPRSGVWELVLIELAHPGQRRLVGHGLFPAFSPVDGRIVYQRARERGGRWFSLWTLDLAHANPGPPTEIAASSNAALITPAWSPDGKRVVFCTVLDPAADSNPDSWADSGASGADGQPGTSRADVWVCDADGGQRTRLTRGGYAHLQPAWANDPSGLGSIYFVSDRSARGSENVYALQVPDVQTMGSHDAVFEASVPDRP